MLQDGKLAAWYCTAGLGSCAGAVPLDPILQGHQDLLRPAFPDCGNCIDPLSKTAAQWQDAQQAAAYTLLILQN